MSVIFITKLSIMDYNMKRDEFIFRVIGCTDTGDIKWDAGLLHTFCAVIAWTDTDKVSLTLDTNTERLAVKSDRSVFWLSLSDDEFAQIINSVINSKKVPSDVLGWIKEFHDECHGTFGAY